MRTLKSKYLSNIKIEESTYKADFIVLEKYQAFSAEILRLSLLGIAIYGFLIANVIFKTPNDCTTPYLKAFVSNKLTLAPGIIMLLVSSLCAIAHRYYSTDCMTHFIRSYRLGQKVSELKQQVSRTDDENSYIAELNITIQNEKKALSETYLFADVPCF